MAENGIAKLKEYCEANDRVCPGPEEWMRMWEMLPNRKRGTTGWEQPDPVILGGWRESKQALKTLFIKHIEWAARHGSLHDIDQFLRSLPETSWHHAND